jgi:hypothetical protein
MIRLSLPTENYPLNLPGGVTVTVRPCTMTVYQAALGAARSALLSAVTDASIGDGTTVANDGSFEGGDANFRRAFVQAAFAKELAHYGIVDWNGVKDADGTTDAQVTPENISALVSIPTIGSSFLDQYTTANVLMAAEGNA